MTDEADDRLGQLAQRWQTDKSPRVALQLAEEYRRQERYDEAAQVLEESVAEHPQSISGRVALGRVLLEGGRDQRAAEVLGEVIDNDATQLVASKLLVEAFIRLGRADDARERLRYYGLLNDSDPDIPELRQRIGELASDDPSSLDDTRAPGSAAPDVAPAAPAVPSVDEDEDEDWDGDGDDDEDDDLFDLGAPAPETAPQTGQTAAPVVRDTADDPFPDLAGEPGTGAGTLDDDDPFDFLAPAPAAEPAAAHAEPPVDDDPFELGSPPTAPLADDPLADILDETVGAARRPSPMAEPTPEPPTVAEPVFEAEPAVEPGTAPELDDAFELPEPAVETETAPVAPVAPVMEAEAEPEPEPALATATPSPAEAPAATTATLGQLYLRQGHLDEAEEIFHQVLDRDPSHDGARTGLDEVARRREADQAPSVEAPSEGAAVDDRRSLTAEDLLAGDRPEGLTAKKRLLLERYLERIRRSADADVH